MGTSDEMPVHPKRGASRTQQFIFVGDKDLRKLQKAAWDAGWWPENKKRGIMWQAPDTVRHVMVHRSNSDHHAYANLLAEFRSAGLQV